jgi:hypothetical protein
MVGAPSPRIPHDSLNKVDDQVAILAAGASDASAMESGPAPDRPSSPFDRWMTNRAAEAECVSHPWYALAIPGARPRGKHSLAGHS